MKQPHQTTSCESWRAESALNEGKAFATFLIQYRNLAVDWLSKKRIALINKHASLKYKYMFTT
jgi:hypothetical protein